MGVPHYMEAKGFTNGHFIRKQTDEVALLMISSLSDMFFITSVYFPLGS